VTARGQLRKNTSTRHTWEKPTPKTTSAGVREKEEARVSFAENEAAGFLDQHDANRRASNGWCTVAGTCRGEESDCEVAGAKGKFASAPRRGGERMKGSPQQGIKKEGGKRRYQIY